MNGLERQHTSGVGRSLVAAPYTMGLSRRRFSLLKLVPCDRVKWVK